MLQKRTNKNVILICRFDRGLPKNIFFHILCLLSHILRVTFQGVRRKEQLQAIRCKISNFAEKLPLHERRTTTRQFKAFVTRAILINNNCFNDHFQATGSYTPTKVKLLELRACPIEICGQKLLNYCNNFNGYIGSQNCKCDKGLSIKIEGNFFVKPCRRLLSSEATD